MRLPSQIITSAPATVFETSSPAVPAEYKRKAQSCSPLGGEARNPERAKLRGISAGGDFSACSVQCAWDNLPHSVSSAIDSSTTTSQQTSPLTAQNTAMDVDMSASGDQHGMSQSPPPGQQMPGQPGQGTPSSTAAQLSFRRYSPVPTKPPIVTVTTTALRQTRADFRATRQRASRACEVSLNDPYFLRRGCGLDKVPPRAAG